MYICDQGILFLDASNHEVKFVAQLITEGTGHATSFSFFLDLVQNQILKPFLTKDKKMSSSLEAEKKKEGEHGILLFRQKDHC